MKEPRPARPLPPGQQLAAPGKWPLVGERTPAPPAPASLPASEPDAALGTDAALRSDAVLRSDAATGAAKAGLPPLAPERLSGSGDADGWSLRIFGLVDRPQRWTVGQLAELPTVERAIDIHCVTRWSMLDTVWRGVPLRTLLAAAVPQAESRFLSFVSRSPRRHSTSLPLADIEQLDPMVAWHWQGAPIPAPHGGPLRLIVPDRYFYKSLKWLEAIEVLAEDRLGYWEREAGYHNRADPWREERFVAAGVTRAEAARILRDLDLSGLNVLGLDGSHRELDGLRASHAVLRAADFSRSQLGRADFRHANLSGASFRDARLAGADFSAADVEGVDFRGADLRGVDFRGASLFGVWLVEETAVSPAVDGGGTVERDNGVSTLVDATTRFDPAVWEQLSPVQAAFLARAMGLPRSV